MNLSMKLNNNLVLLVLLFSQPAHAGFLWFGNNDIQDLSISGDTASITGTAFNKRSPKADKAYTRTQGHNVGIDQMNRLSPDQFMPPYWNGRGIASGDIDKDGYADIALATENGVRLYKNLNGEKFKRISISTPKVDKLDVFIVALVDLNNDGWLDLFLTSYSTGNHFILSDKGNFSEDNLQKAPASPLVLTKSLSFGDIDKNGYLDAALGNWFYGYLKHHPPKDSDIYILLNNKAQFTPKYVPGIAGETLSILLSDFSGDGNLDLMVGNDFAPPDHFYLGNGRGDFQQIKAQDGVIPTSTTTTMSMDTADFDNDLDLDIYVAQIAAGATGASSKLKAQPWKQYCNEIETKDDKQACIKSIRQRALFNFGAKHQPGNITRCKIIPDMDARRDCISMMILLTATREKKIKICDKIPKSNPQTKFTCKSFFTPNKPVTKQQLAEAIPSIKNENVLLVANENKKFTNKAKILGIEATGWSWSAKFFDADNDEWQDLLVLNGTWIRIPGTPPKFFFHNQKGKKFENKTDEFGLQNYMLQSAFTTVDIDNDGDLDILANSTSGPIWFYRNNTQSGNAVEFILADSKGNHNGIGSKIIIHYGKGNHQIREIKSGGAFQSFDAPVVHFGLGKHDTIKHIEVMWSTGERTEIKGDLPANTIYKISRK